MRQEPLRQVTDDEGPVGVTDGVVMPASEEREGGKGGGNVAVRLDGGGGQILVPCDMLLHQPDGSFRLTVLARELLSNNPAIPDSSATQTVTSIPVAEEQVRVGTRQRATGKVVVRVAPETREEVIDLPLTSQHVEVRRVEVNQFVDAPPPVRQDGDTLVVPVLEEVLVVERRLLLREEVHVARRSETRREPQHVELRTEIVEVLRDDSPSAPPPPA